MRIRTVEYEPGWGWIARDPRTGKEVIHDFRWSSRAIARQVVSGVRYMAHQNSRETSAFRPGKESTKPARTS